MIPFAIDTSELMMCDSEPWGSTHGGSRKIPEISWGGVLIISVFCSAIVFEKTQQNRSVSLGYARLASVRLKNEPGFLEVHFWCK